MMPLAPEDKRARKLSAAQQELRRPSHQGGDGQGEGGGGGGGEGEGGGGGGGGGARGGLSGVGGRGGGGEGEDGGGGGESESDGCGGCPLRRAPRTQLGQRAAFICASEPLTTNVSEWHLIAENSMLCYEARNRPSPD